MASLRVRYKVVAKFALQSRFIVIVIQFLANILIPDHDAGVFNPPRTNQESVTWLDSVISTIFGGFRRWDALYFLHIAEHGYTYENCVAFFPLYPTIVSLAKAVSSMCPVLSVSVSLLLFGVAFNIVTFIAASLLLLRLGEKLLQDDRLAYYAALLFCINPASIFMTAPYTETLFVCLSLGGMLCATCNRLLLAALLFGASSLARSNGVVSVGFILHSLAMQYVATLASVWRFHHQQKLLLIKEAVQETLLLFFRALFLLMISLIPFALYQYYIYTLFCFPEKQESVKTLMPGSVASYGRLQGYKLLGDKPASAWCWYRLPLSYSYIQTQHWGIGFLAYYQLKQIPRFILSSPIFTLSVCACWSYYQRQPEACKALGLIKTQGAAIKSLSSKKHDDDNRDPRSKRHGWDSEKLVVYVLHIVFLTAFGSLFMHIEVLTRFLCSASPIIYWYAAHLVVGCSPGASSHKYYSYISAEQGVDIAFGLLQDYKHSSVCGKLVMGYFLAYSLIGTIAFSNFLPWT